MQFERRTITQTIKVPTNTGRTVDEHTKAYLNRSMDVMDSMGIGMWPAIVSASQLGADDELQEILGDAMVGDEYEDGDGYSRNGLRRVVDDTDIPEKLTAWRDAAVKAALEGAGQAARRSAFTSSTPLVATDEWGRPRCQQVGVYADVDEFFQCAMVADHDGDCDPLPIQPSADEAERLLADAYVTIPVADASGLAAQMQQPNNEN
jgi:hypothetical protein